MNHRSAGSRRLAPALLFKVFKPLLRRSIGKAHGLIGRRVRLWNLLRKVVDKMGHTPALLPRFRTEVGAFARLLYRWLRGEYTSFSKTPLVLITAGLLYFISPMDLIVDFLPGIGYLDDATVIALLYQALRPEIKKFEEWERQR
ncbi:MAG: YkvA family protein [Rhodothermales bacterium]|mgnify:CR=1 FL=1|nr:YkvA family protein [Rhodothermales bacterium]